LASRLRAETEGEHFVRLWTVDRQSKSCSRGPHADRRISAVARDRKGEDRGGREDRCHPAASRDYLLLQKAESFVSRRVVKARDAFDIRLLLLRGAKLDSVLKGHLEDALKWREVGREEINERIERVNPKLCRRS